MKLQKRLKWELRKSKQELFSFCKQFNYDPFKTSTSKDCNGECSSKPYKKHYKSKRHRKPFRDFRELSYKKPSTPYKKLNFSKKKEFKAKTKTPFNYKEVTCYKCGKKCHTAKYCRMNRKLHELGLDEETLSMYSYLSMYFFLYLRVVPWTQVRAHMSLHPGCICINILVFQSYRISMYKATVSL